VKDPQIKVFGRYPGKPVSVRMAHTKDSSDLLRDLTEFVYKNAKLMEFSAEKPNLWNTILTAVLSTSSYEHQVFKQNLDKLIA
jgi:hypothetical protein